LYCFFQSDFSLKEVKLEKMWDYPHEVFSFELSKFKNLKFEIVNNGGELNFISLTF